MHVNAGDTVAVDVKSRTVAMLSGALAPGRVETRSSVAPAGVADVGGSSVVDGSLLRMVSGTRAIPEDPVSQQRNAATVFGLRSPSSSNGINQVVEDVGAEPPATALTVLVVSPQHDAAERIMRVFREEIGPVQESAPYEDLVRNRDLQLAHLNSLTKKLFPLLEKLKTQLPQSKGALQMVNAPKRPIFRSNINRVWWTIRDGQFALAMATQLGILAEKLRRRNVAFRQQFAEPDRNGDVDFRQPDRNVRGTGRLHRHRPDLWRGSLVEAFFPQRELAKAILGGADHDDGTSGCVTIMLAPTDRGGWKATFGFFEEERNGLLRRAGDLRRAGAIGRVSALTAVHLDLADRLLGLHTVLRGRIQ